jgi:excisionase family DNA binding protein
MEQQLTDLDPLPLLSLRQVADKLRWSIDSVRRRIKSRELPFYRLGVGPCARIRISRHDLETYLARNYVAAAGKAAKKAARKIRSGKPKQTNILTATTP